MVLRVFAFAFVVTLALATPVAAQQIVTLPPGSWANDVTPDGSVVVGTYPGGGFIWRWKQDPAPTIVPGGDIVAVSDDGNVVAGTIIDPGVNAEVAAIWTQATGWQSLGWLPNALSCPSRSNAYGISGDGTTVVGLSWNGCNGRGFRWTAATGMQELQSLANGNNRCSAISRDGSTLGGFAQGTFTRTPAYWAPNLTGAVLDPSFMGEVYGFSNDGRFSVGTLYQDFSQNYFDAFVRDSHGGVITNLGSIHTDWAAAATDLSEDGKVIVGYDYISLSRQAWVWTPTEGMRSLNDRLTSLGVIGAPPLLVCRAVSDDGNVIVGGAQTGGFIVQMSALIPYGTGTPGCSGLPVLTGSPAPHVNTPTFALKSTNAPPLSLGLWMITNTADTVGSDPFAIGATLYLDLFAATLLVTANGTSDATGLGTAQVPIPNNASIAGATIYAQVLWAWPSGACTSNYPLPFGLSTSNGLAITILQ